MYLSGSYLAGPRSSITLLPPKKNSPHNQEVPKPQVPTSEKQGEKRALRFNPYSEVTEESFRETNLKYFQEGNFSAGSCDREVSSNLSSWETEAVRVSLNLT